ncbi:MAG: TRAP transporter large permease [Deltaproteobacteria bacterium]|nr:MAG: TRAP transporter large permease [Deltaproteobacteria bacterium]
MTAGIILFLVIAGLLVLRVNIVGVLLVAISYIHYTWGDGVLVYVIEDMWTAINKEVLLAIPLFMLCGSVMSKGDIAKRLIMIMQELTRPLPGGMAIATILTCSIFAAISGSSAVTLIAVGSIAYPGLVKQNYSKRFSMGAVVAGGTLGVIIPPSIPMILYGIVTETSIVDLFKGGVIPGIVLVGILSFYSFYVNRHIPHQSPDFSAISSALKEGIWSLLMPVILLGGIYSGHFSPTESAAVALAYSLVIEMFVHRGVTIRNLIDTAIETTIMLGTLFPLLAIAFSINMLLTSQGVPAALAAWVGSFVSSKITFLLLINVLLLGVGCIMDMTSAIMVLAPLLLQLSHVYNIDPVHLGIIMTVNLEIGLLTPPVGINLIVAMTAFKEDFGLIIKGVLPFIFLMLTGLLLISFIPELTLYLVR